MSIDSNAELLSILVKRMGTWGNKEMHRLWQPVFLNYLNLNGQKMNKFKLSKSENLSSINLQMS